MSDTSQGPDWWLASDGKWYAPQPAVQTPVLLAPSISRDLSPLVQQHLQTLDANGLAMFSTMYGRKKRSVGAMIALAIFFPIQLFLLRKVGLGVVFWFTGFGIGIWYVVEWFLTAGRVRDYNNEVATEILMQMKVLTPAPGIVPG